MKKHDEGFSLVEVLVSMVILAAIVIPTCTSLVLSFRLNAKSESLMQAQLAVSSAVETLMAKGIKQDYLDSLEHENGSGYYKTAMFEGIRFWLADEGEYFSVTVSDDKEQVVINTCIRDTTGKDWPEVDDEET